MHEGGGGFSFSKKSSHNFSRSLRVNEKMKPEIGVGGMCQMRGLVLSEKARSKIISAPRWTKRQLELIFLIGVDWGPSINHFLHMSVFKFSLCKVRTKVMITIKSI